jgi:transposase InsO family protein
VECLGLCYCSPVFFCPTESDRLTPIDLRRRVKPTTSESFVASLKCELLYGHRFPSREAARIVTFGYIEGFYDQVRRHSSLGTG